MVKENSITWNNEYQNDGILYFMQRIIEMLDYDTIDIFRAPLLNTTRLIDEYLQISAGAAKAYHLQEVFNELKATLKNDIVLINKLTEERVNQIISKLNADDDKNDVIEYLSKSITPNYLNWCLEYIKSIVPQNKQKSKIERAIRCYIPELFRYGYNREDIYFTYKEKFSITTNPSETFYELLDSFKGTPHTYSVYLSISNEVLEFKDILENNLKCSFDDDGNFKKLTTWKDYFVIKLPQMKSVCMTSALESAINIINTFLRFYQFFGNYSNKIIQNHALVTSNDGQERILYTSRDKYNSIEDDDHPRTGKLSELVITGLFRRSRCSVSELKKVLKLHNSAISNNGLENGFLNFWSILEITCVTDSDGLKLTQVIDKLIPILKLKYIGAYFEHISSDLKQITDVELWEKVLSSISEGTTVAEKIAYLTLCPKYSEVLDSYTDSLQSYPVLRSRILNMHDDYSSCRRNFFNHLEHYDQRLSWHLYRIYRARNAITHNGKQPQDLKDLGEHLHAYVDCLLEEILVKMCMGALCQISNVFVDSKLYLESIQTYLKNDLPFDEEGIGLMFSAQYFCWCNNKKNTENSLPMQK